LVIPRSGNEPYNLGRHTSRDGSASGVVTLTGWGKSELFGPGAGPRNSPAGTRKGPPRYSGGFNLRRGKDSMLGIKLGRTIANSVCRFMD